MRAWLTVFILTASLAAQGPQPPVRRAPQPGVISGRLFTHDGSPAAGVRVSALEVGNALFPDSQSLISIALTDSVGRYRLEQVPPGRYFITAGALDLPTYFPGADAASSADIVTMVPAANLTGMNFSLAISSGLSFRGKLVRQDNAGRIITGPVPATPSSQPTQIRLQGLNGEGSRVAVVGADASFDFPQVRPGTYQINILPSQFRMPQLNVTLLDRDITDYELVVPLMVQVTGTVTVEDGGPAPRFPIVFSNASDLSPLLTPSSSGVQQNITAQAAAPRFSAQVPVGANRVTLGDLPNGFTVKKVVADGVDLNVNPLLVTPAGAPQIQVVLGAATVPWVHVSGRVNGRAIPNGNTINVSSNQGTSGPLQVVFYLDGSFEIPKALPGSYRVGGGGPAASDLVVPTGVPDVRTVIDFGAAPDSGGAATAADAPSSAVRVSGRIVGRAKALPGAQVRIENAETGEFRSAPIYVDGSFEFQHVQPGNYVAAVTPSIPGAEPASFTVGVRDIGDLQVLVPAYRDIAGKVTLEGAGEPPRTLVFVAASSRIPADVRADGSFTVALPDGFAVTIAADTLPETYAVSALQYGMLDLAANPMRLSGPGTELQVALKTARGAASISGRVSGDTAALGGIRVWLTDTNGRQRALETTPDPTGAFVFSNVGEGAYTVSLAAPGISANVLSAAVAMTAGRNGADVNLIAPRAVNGRVIVDGAPWAQPQRFGLQLNGGPAGASTIAIDPKPDGSFSIFLPTGERTVGPATGLPAGFEIRAITYGSLDLLKSPLRVPAAGALEELTIHLLSASR